MKRSVIFFRLSANFNNNSCTDTGLFFMFGIAALFLCPASQSTGFDADTIETLLTNTEFNACIMLIYTVTCIVFMGIWYYRSCGGNYLPKPSLTFHPLQFLSIILLIPGMQFFSGYLTSAVSLLFPNWLSQYEKLMETAGLDSDIGLFLFIYAVILGPVCEELVFRGVTMRLVRRALPFWAANLMQAVLFGIFHMNWIQGIYAFVLGLVLGWICEKEEASISQCSSTSCSTSGEPSSDLY